MIESSGRTAQGLVPIGSASALARPLHATARGTTRWRGSPAMAKRESSVMKVELITPESEPSRLLRK